MIPLSNKSPQNYNIHGKRIIISLDRLFQGKRLKRKQSEIQEGAAPKGK